MASAMSNAEYTANVNRMRQLSTTRGGSAAANRLRRGIEAEERRREREGEAIPRTNRFR